QLARSTMKVNFKPEPRFGRNSDAAIEIRHPALNGTANGKFASLEPGRSDKPTNFPSRKPSRRNWFKSAYALIDSSFRIKVLLPVVTCLAVTVAATFYVMNRRLA